MIPWYQIKANYRQENPPGSRTLGDFPFKPIRASFFCLYSTRQASGRSGAPRVAPSLTPFFVDSSVVSGSSRSARIQFSGPAYIYNRLKPTIDRRIPRGQGLWGILFLCPFYFTVMFSIRRSHLRLNPARRRQSVAGLPD
jgi:hypothetical protein